MSTEQLAVVNYTPHFTAIKLLNFTRNLDSSKSTKMRVSFFVLIGAILLASVMAAPDPYPYPVEQSENNLVAEPGPVSLQPDAQPQSREQRQARLLLGGIGLGLGFGGPFSGFGYGGGWGGYPYGGYGYPYYGRYGYGYGYGQFGGGYPYGGWRRYGLFGKRR